MKEISLAMIGIFAVKILSAQLLHDNPLKTRLDSVVDKAARNYMTDSNRVGISIGFVTTDKSYIYNYGETAPGSHILPSSRSIYEIGSLTKTFTGLLVAHAISEGKMNINDDIRKYLPGNFPNLQYPGNIPVKLGYLLAHTAQFPNHFEDSTAGLLMNEETFLQNIHAIKLDTLKPYNYAYSNAGYQLVGYMLEQLYQLSYDDLVKKYITGPLQMQHTQLNYPTPGEKELLKGYNSGKKAVPPVATAVPGAGSLHSTVPDMLRYLKYQLSENDKAVKWTHKIIYGSIDQDAKGFQWSIGKTWNWDYYIRADGGTMGFRSFCVMYPDLQVGIIILSNQTDNTAGTGLYHITVALFNALKTIHNSFGNFDKMN